MKKSKKFLLESGVLLTALTYKAKKAGKSIKEYFYEAETIKHISLVLYDLLPLSVKIGMRYEKFHEIFERNFKAIRDALLGTEINVVLTKEDNKELVIVEEKPPVKRVRKTPIKKVTVKKETIKKEPVKQNKTKTEK